MCTHVCTDNESLILFLMCVCVPSYQHADLQPQPYMVESCSAVGVVSNAVNILVLMFCLSMTLL